MNKIFTDKHYILQSFAHTVWVHCPKCQKKATIRHLTHQDIKKYPPEIYCQHCGYFDKQSIFYNLMLKRNCPHCGKFFQFTMENLGEKKEKLNISCPHCGKSEYYQPNYLAYYEDPFFDSQLWLQKPFRGNLFWAYNATHLAYLKEFIAADIRKRYPYWRGYISRLPDFIKAKKNRTGLLKIIRQLEEKVE